MVQAYILIQTEVGRASAVTSDVTGIDGVTRAQAVTGPYDVVVLAEAPDVGQLGRVVVPAIQTIPGITRTLTCPVVSPTPS